MRSRIKAAGLVLTAFVLSGAGSTDELEVCRNRTGTHDGFYYTFWKDGGEACMTLGPDGSYQIDYQLGRSNMVVGTGWNPGSTTRKIGYNAAEFEAGTNSYLTLYGWSTDPLIEYYVVDGWGSNFTPPGEGAPVLGTIETDGGTYNIYRTTRVKKPSIRGIQTFNQFWSVRTKRRPIGTDQTIDFPAHVAAWASHGLKLGKMNYQVIATEGYGSTGRASIRVWEE
jgi:endo-1,4-beta-xylanase